MVCPLCLCTVCRPAFRTFCSLLLIIINLLINLNYARQQFELRIMNLWRAVSDDCLLVQHCRIYIVLLCGPQSAATSRPVRCTHSVCVTRRLAFDLFDTHVARESGTSAATTLCRATLNGSELAVCRPICISWLRTAQCTACVPVCWRWKLK